MLTTGDKVPDITVKDQDGNPINLRGFSGKKIVLYFYPKDQTPGCTAESCNLRDNYKLLQKAGYTVFGVSSDDEKSHQKFIRKESLPFSLLADTDKKLHEAFGTWVEKSMYGRKYMGTARVTFLINENGLIEEVIEKVDTANHTSQILKTGTPTVKPAPVKSAKKSVAKKVVKKVAAEKAPAKKATKKSTPKKVVTRKSPGK